MAATQISQIPNIKPQDADSNVVVVQTGTGQKRAEEVKKLSYKLEDNKFLTILVSITLFIIVFVLAYFIAYQAR